MKCDWRDDTVEAVDRTLLHYIRSPAQGSTWVYLHGFSDSGLTWKRLAQRMPAGLDVVLLDSRNHGESGPGPGGHDNLVYDVVTLIEALRVPHVNLVGHSIGARTALGVGARRPDLVRKLVLLDPPLRLGPIHAPHEERLHALRGMLENWSRSNPDQLLDLARRQHPDWDAIDYPSWVQSKSRVRSAAADDIVEVAWRHLAQTCTVDTVLAFGEENRGGIVSVEVADEFVRLARNSRAVQILGCGHNIHRENFDGAVDFLAGEWK